MPEAQFWHVDLDNKPIDSDIPISDFFYEGVIARAKVQSDPDRAQTILYEGFKGWNADGIGVDWEVAGR